jgi:hypothetical protein
MLSELDDRDLHKFESALEYGNYTSCVEHLINLAQNLDCYELHPDITSQEELGHYHAEMYETISIPEHLANYIDYESYGRDIEINEGGVFTDNGYIVENGDTFTEHYKGWHIPDDYRIFAYPDKPEKIPIKEQLEMFGKMVSSSINHDKPMKTIDERA